MFDKCRGTTFLGARVVRDGRRAWFSVLWPREAILADPAPAPSIPSAVVSVPREAPFALLRIRVGHRHSVVRAGPFAARIAPNNSHPNSRSEPAYNGP